MEEKENWARCRQNARIKLAELLLRCKAKTLSVQVALQVKW